MHEIEACINSRPLTFVGDSLGADLPLTPSHFLTGKLVGFQPETSDFNEVIVSPKDLSSRDIVCRQRLDHFWSRWSSDYLRNLPPTVNRFFPRGDLRVGSVVLIREDNVPRLKWPLGRVQELFPGKDGVTRSVSLKTAKGVVTRSIQKLHDLEVNDQTASSLSETLKSDTDNFHVSDEQTCVDNSIKTDSDVNNYVSRSGRIIKPVRKLDL